MKSFCSVICKYCYKEFQAPVIELKRNNGKFCSRSCSAAFGNSLRKKQPIPNLKCDLCGKQFYRKPSLIKSTRNYCSEGCFREATGRAFTKEKIIAMIKGFTGKYGRIPLQEEFSLKKGWVNPSTVVQHFGSWNRAIEEAGFSPNSASIGYVCYAKDGHLCRSYNELLIDNWLTDNGIEHDKEVKYPGSRLIADWQIGSTFVEYLGIDTERTNTISQNYSKTLERKKRLCEEQGITLILLTPIELDDLKYLEALR